MESEYALCCDRCHERFTSHLPPFSGRCNHSQCEKCAQKDISCPTSNCSPSAFIEPNKNFTAMDFLEIIEKAEEDIIAVKKGLYRKAETLPIAPPQPKPRRNPPGAGAAGVSDNLPKKSINGSMQKNGNMNGNINDKAALNPSPIKAPAQSQKKVETQKSSEEYGLLVSNLPPVTEKQLKMRFGDKVTRCVVCLNFNQQPSGVACVYLASREDAEQGETTRKQEKKNKFKMNKSSEGYGLLVSNLPPVTEEQLKMKFGDKVTRCVVCLDFDGQQSGQAYVYLASREDAEQGETTRKQEKKNKFKMNKIYVGNLPVSIDSITLESLFALCGPILTSQIHKYVDTRNHEEVERAYGFITFKNHDSLAKAVYFHRKVYEGLVLIVHHADSYHYSTFLGGIPQHVKLDYITMFLQTHFGDRFYSNINYVPGKGPNGQGCLWVSFKDEETRRKYLNLTCLFFSTNSPNINENQKLLPRDTKEGDYVNIVILKVPDGTQNYQIKTMFQLCGQIGPSIQIPPTENSYTKTFLSITRSGYETARKFDNLKVKDWPVPIRVVPKEQHDDVLKAEYPHTVLMRNFDSNYSLKELEAKFFEGFGPDSVRLLKSKKDKSFIYVNCKDQSEKEKILNVSGKIYFGGAEPATFEPFEEMKKADSMESIASNASRIAKNRTSKGRKTVSPTLSTNSLQQQDEWRITVENIGADTNLMKLPQLFSKIGKVKNFTSGPNNSYIFQLTPNL